LVFETAKGLAHRNLWDIYSGPGLFMQLNQVTLWKLRLKFKDKQQANIRVCPNHYHDDRYPRNEYSRLKSGADAA
jgi:hypothetical protein